MKQKKHYSRFIIRQVYNGASNTAYLQHIPQHIYSKYINELFILNYYTELIISHTKKFSNFMCLNLKSSLKKIYKKE